jgi:hypothetical protein
MSWEDAQEWQRKRARGSVGVKNSIEGGGGLVDEAAANRVTDEQARVMNPPWMLVVAADQDCVAPRPWLPQREGPQFSVCETH